jgi:signal transduction histidine kinase
VTERLGGAKSQFMPVALGLLAVLLAVLATLQYRWLEQVRVAERERLRAGARRHADDFARDFDRQLAQAWAWLLVDSDTLRERAFERYARRREQWLSLARHPELVRDVYLVERGEGVKRLLRFDPEKRDFEPEPWPDSLLAVKERIAPLLESAKQEAPSWRGPPDPVVEEAMAFVAAIPELPPPRPGVRRDWRGARLAGFTVVAFDAAAIRNQVLPALIQRHFEGGHESAFSVAVFNAQSGQRIAGDAGIEWSAPAESEAGLFALRLEDAGGDLARASGRNPAPEGARPPRTLIRRPRPPQDEAARWVAKLRHRGGPVDAVVARAQARNLAVGFSILGLLGASGVLLLTLAQRTRRLAEQQIAFVASVSHELRTPVTVIATSAANLADGVVREPEQVKRYGSLIQQEARRLGEMVSQVLEFAAPPAAERRPLDLAAVVGDAAQAVEPERLAAGIGLRVEVDQQALHALGDAAALRRGVLNLLTNAIKYGRPGTDVVVSVSREGGELLLSVADRGIGIPESERERIFEPFYRGREAVAAQIRGNGLGLSLVRRIAAAHGGRVSVDSVHGEGSRFTLRLPAPAPEALDQALHPESGVPQTNPTR